MENILDTYITAYQGGHLYDFDNEIAHKWYPQRVIKLTENAQSMLELGLGHGFTTDIFAKHFKRYIVLDASPVVIDNFIKNYPDCTAQIVETYFENFDTDENFDVINMGFIMEHIDNPFEILMRFKKFLAPGGKIFVTVPNAEVLNRRLGNLAGLLPDMFVLSDHDLSLGHKRYYSIDSLTKEIENAGYIVDRIEGVYLKPFTTKQMISLNFDKKIINALCEIGIQYPELSLAMMAQIRLPD
jgi:SAM-dependent methyltransferase